MKSNPLISVLIPTYNRDKYLKECLDSVLSQKGFNNKDIEYIISDNSDNDITKKLLDKYKKKYQDKNIIYIKNKKNLGMVGNWNNLIKLSSGEYFIFLSDDDKFYNNVSLKKLYTKIVDNNINAACGIKKFIDENGGIIDTSNTKHDFIINKKTLRIGNIPGFGGILFKYFEGLEFDKDCLWSADWDFNIMYTSKYSNILYISDPVFRYRRHLESTSNESAKFYVSDKIVLKKHYPKDYWFILIRRFFFGKTINQIINISKKIGIYKPFSFFRRKYILRIIYKV